MLGRNIKRYQTNFADLWLITTFPALNIEINEYPAMKNYLESFLPKLDQTGETFINHNGDEEKTRKRSENKWFETQDPSSF